MATTAADVATAGSYIAQQEAKTWKNNPCVFDDTKQDPFLPNPLLDYRQTAVHFIAFYWILPFQMHLKEQSHENIKNVFCEKLQHHFNIQKIQTCFQSHGHCTVGVKSSLGSESSAFRKRRYNVLEPSKHNNICKFKFLQLQRSRSTVFVSRIVKL